MSELGHDDLLKQLSADLPFERPDDSRREAVRSALLTAARDEGQRGAGTVTSIFSRRRTAVIGGVVMAAAAAAAIVAVVSSGGRGGGVAGGSRALASVEAGSGASYDRHVEQTPTGSDEVIRVRAGSLHVASGVMAAGDHLKVDSGDVEVDASGELDVVVIADAMDHVTVRSGTAKVVMNGHAVFLAAGQTWHAATITADVIPTSTWTSTATATATENVPSTPSPTPSPIPSPLPSPTPSPSPTTVSVAAPRLERQPRTAAEVRQPQPRAVREDAPSPSTIDPSPSPSTSTSTSAAIQLSPPASPALPSATEQHFQRGEQLLRDGHPADAAAELALAADASDNPLANDARYFQAVALVKANRPADAERAALAFLDHAPTSPRRGRASVMLGRLVATHDQGSARAWFSAALHDSDPSVAAAAQAGLASLSR